MSTAAYDCRTTLWLAPARATACDSDGGTGFDVLGHHLFRVHAIHVVGTEDQAEGFASTGTQQPGKPDNLAFSNGHIYTANQGVYEALPVVVLTIGTDAAFTAFSKGLASVRRFAAREAFL